MAGQLTRRMSARPRQPRRTRRQADRRGERYKDAALRGAYRAVAEAAKGERHSVFFKEAASLARPALGATDAEITDTLLPVYLRVSDDTDEEARRILRDALDAGRSGR